MRLAVIVALVFALASCATAPPPAPMEPPTQAAQVRALLPDGHPWKAMPADKIDDAGRGQCAVPHADVDLRDTARIIGDGHPEPGSGLPDLDYDQTLALLRAMIVAYCEPAT